MKYAFSLASMAFVFLFVTGLGQKASADYYDLARQKAATDAADQRASDWERVRRWSASMNGEITGAMNSFVRQHGGLATQPKYELGEYGDCGTDIKVNDNIKQIIFSTQDHYECKADWGLLYDAEVHLQVNCINSVTGKEINLYPKGKRLTR